MNLPADIARKVDRTWYARQAGCTGKAPFESRALAEKVALRRRKQGKRDNHAYKCRFCGKWHIGTSGQ